MAKETQKEKIERLERELEQVTKQRDEVFREVSALRRQINAAVEDTDAYKSIVAALQEEQLKVKVAQHSYELTEKMNRQLRNANADLQEKYDAAVTSYAALESDYKQAHEELQHMPAKEPHNARGAGRKPKITEEQTEIIITMNAQGVSSRKIAKEVGLSPSTVLRIIKAAENN